MKDIKQGGKEFHELCKGLTITQFERGSYIFRKKDFINSVYFLLCGEVLRFEEKSLNLDRALHMPLKGLKEFMGRYLLMLLGQKKFDIFVRTQLERIREKSGNSVVISFGNNVKFLTQHGKKWRFIRFYRV